MSYFKNLFIVTLNVVEPKLYYYHFNNIKRTAVPAHLSQFLSLEVNETKKRQLVVLSRKQPIINPEAFPMSEKLKIQLYLWPLGTRADRKRCKKIITHCLLIVYRLIDRSRDGFIKARTKFTPREFLWRTTIQVPGYGLSTEIHPLLSN